jgi:prepilin-type N-terminal cleavage/methylation domain-containing protein
MPPTTGTGKLRAPHGAARGFTLIELMVVVAILGLAMSAVFTGGSALLPQARLRSSATTMAVALEQVRTTAVLKQEPLIFAYDLEGRGYEAYYPYDRDERGENIGPGRTPVREWAPLEPGIAFAEVRLPGSSARDRGYVPLMITALGRIPPHEVVIVNPDYADVEIMTVRVSGIANRSTIHDGDDRMAPLTDVDFK